jgi:hypothetical protein
MSYFAARHRARERLKLLQLSGGNADDNAYADFAFHILRQARGLRATAFEGKGASICSRYGARIAVWAIGPPVSRDRAPFDRRVAEPDLCGPEFGHG